MSLLIHGLKEEGLKVTLESPDEKGLLHQDSDLRLKADSGDVDAILELAENLDHSGNLELAISYWLRAVALGSPVAMFNLGVVAKDNNDFKEAESWYKKAAELGDLDSMFNLGALFKDLGDIPQAIIWWERAEQLGDLDAKKNLEITRSLGLDPAQPVEVESLTLAQIKNLAFLHNKWGNKEESAYFLGLAVDLGDLGCKNDLALHISEEGNEAEAESMLLECAEAGLVVAMTNLGLLLAKKNQNAEARHWWTVASNLGDEDAATNLAILNSKERQDSKANFNLVAKTADGNSGNGIPNSKLRKF